ncbi:MAG TPA: type II toxin-antitoxin system VapC family toxin [Campylobacterales bacterium]|nr:type II toxin-antitoxin system VapC family toxin [Campylobacterales bacterium]HIP59838.1 type II toxin-antitoxin system VapC family toxin [Campylobacterales bacterium]
MTLLDTNILIEILKGDQDTIEKIENISGKVFISSISAMELYYGALNKAEVKKIEKFISLFKTVHLNKEISIKATKLIQAYAKSHTLDIPDSLIAATAITNRYELITYNIKYFKYIEGLKLNL